MKKGLIRQEYWKREEKESQETKKKKSEKQGFWAKVPIATENRRGQKSILIWKESRKVIVHMGAFAGKIGKKKKRKIEMEKNKIGDKERLDIRGDKVIWKRVITMA